MILLLFMPAAILVLGGTAVLWAPWLHVQTLPVRQRAKLILQIAASPIGWEFDRHHARHQTGVSVWIANSPSSAAVSIGCDSSPHNVGGGNVDTNAKERRLIYRAVTKLRDARQAQEDNDRIAAWARSVSEYADNVVAMKRRAS